MPLTLLVLSIAGLLFGPTISLTAADIRWVPDSNDANRVSVEVHGLDRATLQRLGEANLSTADWQRILSVRVEQITLSADLTIPAMAGRYEVTASGIRFVPAFPVTKDVAYRAAFRPERLPNGDGKVLTSTFKLESPKSEPSTIVKQVHPSGDIVPENLLKFYIHFSAPMSGGHVYEHIHLLDEGGKEVELPFLELEEELWDRAMTRLTLFIDPGRIKRGVQPLEEIGPSLLEGKSFTLRIDADWRDAAGNPLRQGHEKRFAVGPSDREPPDPKDWKVRAAAAGTREELAIQFPEPMDHALALRVIQVVNEAGDAILGTRSLSENERRWNFVPEEPWRAGHYRIRVPSTIEDLAGNNIGKRFEVDLFDTVQRRIVAETSEIPFEIPQVPRRD